jgi:pimeloyl-ACP methyl ester carboxylesterase
MIPGSPFLLAKMFNSRRYTDADYMRRIAPDLYGGEVRRNPGLVEQHRALSSRPHWRGYLYQQLALSGWSSLPWLRLLRQRTLVLAGSDDPLVPLANARLMARLIPHAELKVIDDGHLFMVSHPHKVAPLIRKFLAQPALRY